MVLKGARPTRRLESGDRRLGELPVDVVGRTYFANLSFAKSLCGSQAVDLSAPIRRESLPMITLLLHLFRLFPFLCGGHRQLALENLALRPPARSLQEDGDPAEVARQRSALLGRDVEDVGGLEASSRHRVTRHCSAMAAAPLPRVLDQTCPSAHPG